MRQLIQPILTGNVLDEAYFDLLFKYIPLTFRSEQKNQVFFTLPDLCCQACGGSMQTSRPIFVAWYLLLLGAKILDDVEDGDIKDEMAITINATTGLHFLIQFILRELEKNPETCANSQPIILELNRMMLHACAGQHADLLAIKGDQEEIDPERWLAIARAKSGEFFAWAAWAGALAGDATVSVANRYRTFGYYLGILIQIADDYNDVWSNQHQLALIKGRSSLPIIYALFVLKGEEKNQLTTLLTKVQQGNQEAEKRVLQKLTAIGAQSYLLVTARTHYLQALATLQQAIPDISEAHPLRLLLDQAFPAIDPASHEGKETNISPK
ncbi:MAG: polyprenyl synthetase family protein [Chloroflexota bacterium]